MAEVGDVTLSEVEPVAPGDRESEDEPSDALQPLGTARARLKVEVEQPAESRFVTDTL